MTTIVVIMMMVDDMEEYNDKDAWFVYFSIYITKTIMVR